jgi:hypothetical protein
MNNPGNKKRNYGKIAKVLSIIIGAYYLFTGLAALLSLLLQFFLMDFNQRIGHHYPEVSMVGIKYIIYYYPFLILIGFAYLLFGLKYFKLKTDKFRLNTILATCSIVYSVVFSIAIAGFYDVLFRGFYIYSEYFKVFVVFISILMCILIFAQHAIPQIIIGKMILKEKEQKQGIDMPV